LLEVRYARGRIAVAKPNERAEGVAQALDARAGAPALIGVAGQRAEQRRGMLARALRHLGRDMRPAAELRRAGAGPPQPTDQGTPRHRAGPVERRPPAKQT